MSLYVSAEALARLRQYAAGELTTISREDVRELLEERDFTAPWTAAGKQAAAEAAEQEYHSGSCDDCMCCTHAQCSENRCPTDSIGDSICPCTCY